MFFKAELGNTVHNTGARIVSIEESSSNILKACFMRVHCKCQNKNALMLIVKEKPRGQIKAQR